MKILKPEEVEKKLRTKYNDNPLGWRILYSVDKKGYPSVGLINRGLGEQYWIKYSSWFSPQGIGAIATLNEDFPILNDPLFDKDFGIRFLDLTAGEKEKLLKEGIFASSVLRKIERSMATEKPEPTDPKRIMTEGPYTNLVTGDLSDISPTQRELEIKMQEAIEKLTRRQTSYIG